MNQRQATVALIEFVKQQQEQGTELTRIETKALKVLEKRAEILRVRYERRFATVAEDILAEPLTVTFRQFRILFGERFCVRCWKYKLPDMAFCVQCYNALPADTAKAFKQAKMILHGFSRALRHFQIYVRTDGAGVLWIPRHGLADLAVYPDGTTV